MKDKQKRNLIITIVILIIINITILTVLWIGRPSSNKAQFKNVEKGDKFRISQMLKTELGFSDNQVEEFLGLREEHHKNTEKINKELMQIKRQMFEEAMYKNNEVISDSLLKISLEKQAELEKITFGHFLKVKKICTPEQQKKLFEIVSNLLGPRQQSGPPPGSPNSEIRDDMPPPPPRGERPPIPNGERPPR